MPLGRRKEERMWKLADEMARSGDYSGWLPIEHELRFLGYPRARQLLDNRRVRKELDAKCAKELKGRAEA